MVLSMNKRNTNISGCVVLSYGLIESFKYYGFIEVLLANILGILLGLFSFFLVIKEKGIKRIRPLLLFLMFYSLFGFISHLINGNLDFPELFWPFFFLGFSTLLLNIDIPSTYARIGLYFFVLFSVYFLLIKGVYIYNLETSESRNYCSGYILSLYSIYLIIRIKEGFLSVPWMELLVTWLICILAMGRGGIISSTMLVILSAIYQFSNISRIKNAIRRIIPWLLLFILIIILFWDKVVSLYNYIMSFIEASMDFFEQRGVEAGGRGEFWGEYINKILSTPQSVLIAPEIGGTALLNDFSGNLHNSYLMLYARYGTLVFVVSIMLLFRGFFFLLHEKKYHLLLILFIICLRSFTDVLAFNGVMDITMYYFMFYPIYYKYSKKRIVYE